jgi:hypothetical protein
MGFDNAFPTDTVQGCGGRLIAYGVPVNTVACAAAGRTWEPRSERRSLEARQADGDRGIGWARSSIKLAITASTVLALVGVMQLLHVLRVFHGMP